MVVDKINGELGKPIIKKVGNIKESYRDVYNYNILFGALPCT